jgi:hypothetical protein
MPSCQRLYLAMEKRPNPKKLLARLRAQPWRREVVLAALLTIAAVVFIAAAMLRSDMPEHGTKPAETAQQPPG